MFDEDADAPDEADTPDEASTDIEAFCARCKGDTPHTVVSRYQDEIRRVRCNSCEDIHAYRRPRGDEGGDSVEPQGKRKPLKAKPTWEQVRSKSKSEPRPYNGDEVYCDLDVLTHPVFGVGFVSELIGQNKVEVTFQSDKRILIHNRKLLPLHVVQRQRKEVAAQVKAAGKARAREAKEAKAAAREAAQMAKARTIDDLDMPDDISDDTPDALTDVPVPMTIRQSTKLSPQALAALEEEGGDDHPTEDFDKESGGSQRSKGRKNKPAKARVPANAEANRPAGDSGAPKGTKAQAAAQGNSKRRAKDSGVANASPKKQELVLAKASMKRSAQSAAPQSATAKPILTPGKAAAQTSRSAKSPMVEAAAVATGKPKAETSTPHAKTKGKAKHKNVTAVKPEAHKAAANKSANIAPGSGQVKKNTSLPAKPAPTTKPIPAAKPAPATTPALVTKPGPATKPASATKPAHAAKPVPATNQSRRINQK